MVERNSHYNRCRRDWFKPVDLPAFTMETPLQITSGARTVSRIAKIIQKLCALLRLQAGSGIVVRVLRKLQSSHVRWIPNGRIITQRV